MAINDLYLYDLVHCTDATLSRFNQATAINASPFSGMVVYIDGQPQADIYTVTPIGASLNTAVVYTWMPPVTVTNLTSCADPNNDKMYLVSNCANRKDFRYVLLVAAQTVGTVLQFTGECTCWLVEELISTYTEILTIAATFPACVDCMKAIELTLCDYQERTLGYAVAVQLPVPEPPDRGFSECCYKALVLGDTSDTDPYRNDFSSVFFQRQTDTDTVIFEIIPASTGVPVGLVDITHGVLYPIGATNTNPNLTYFKVEWRKILSVLGVDSYTIRMSQTIAGVGPTVIDSNSFVLKAFTVALANNTVRIDSNHDGTLEDIDVNFKNSGYETSLRVQGYFGDQQQSIEKDSVVFASKKGGKYYSDQITMSNDPEYTFQALNIPECISRQLMNEIIYGNEIFISDYNTNNHSYLYELLPVDLEDIATNDYPVDGRGVHINMTFKDRFKTKRKTNC